MRLVKRLLQFFKILAVNFLLQIVPVRLHLPAKTMEFHMKKLLNVLTEPFKSLNMEDLKDRDIFTLSSGERQKIAFLAATALNPQIYVLDEPSANLDIHTILQVREILFALKSRWTHDCCFRT